LLLRLQLRAVIDTRFLRLSLTVAASSAATLSSIQAQNAGLDLGFGLWWSDSVSTIYSVALFRPLLGPFDYGLGLTHLQGPSGNENQRITGGEISLGMFRNGAGPYLVAAGGVGIRHSSGDFDAQWSAGAGYEIRALNMLSLGLEGRYRVEDRGSRGFWRLDPLDARGVVLQAHVTIRFGAPARASPRRRPQEHTPDRGAEPVLVPAPAVGTPREVADLRNAVVATAIEVMGAPYRWGGQGEDGFDCSGLIQYAYGQHGLILPRMSRDQARMGQQVDRSVGSLLPGDILGFSDGGGGITHVGLYVGDGMFIHSSSSGVKLSSLAAAEGDGRWWQQRWVLARRLIN
jgi:cell wall-associated NlpC family hydrolase